MPVTVLAISSKPFFLKAAESTTFGAEVACGRIRHAELQPDSIRCWKRLVVFLTHAKAGMAAATSTMVEGSIGCFWILEWSSALLEKSLLQHADPCRVTMDGEEEAACMVKWAIR